MLVQNLSSNNISATIFAQDKNNREINIYKLLNAQVVKSTSFYPNSLFYSYKDSTFYKVIEERIMSLKDVNNQPVLEVGPVEKVIDTPVFFFNYNTDNYYHFVYDTLPYLISYRFILDKIPGVKLLMNYPNFQTKRVYKFVSEFLELLGITEEHIIFLEEGHVYNEMYVSSSYTHGHDSNLPPREEIFDLYSELVTKARALNPDFISVSKKLYISRRTWLHNDFTNIGTNYTTRRKFVSEDLLVDKLVAEGYAEIFTENMSTIEKILTFDQATNVIGAIGGGICNVLFSQPSCKLIALVSPTFLDVNKRFIYSLNKVDLQLYTSTYHTEKNTFKKYMRVSIPSKSIIGEINNVLDDKIIVSYTKQSMAGWNNNIQYDEILVNTSDAIALDAGLNSEWDLDIYSLLNII